ncbi:MAG: cyclic nucleotide-binding domain-containing protein [Candidatus Dadabacteria bacterium]|nr:MAG: cyclic nucleotide-binding domain-containing protein [Candidatus Dadabacteria bacterium]
MYSFVEESRELESIATKCKGLISRLASRIPTETKGLKILAGQQLFVTPDERTKLFLLKEGSLSYKRNGRIIVVFDEGDLIGFEQHFCPPLGEIHSDFAVIVDVYSCETFFAAVMNDSELFKLWNQFLAYQYAYFAGIAASLMKRGVAPTPEVRDYSAGDIIIRQGDSAREVFTLVEGCLEVVVDDVVVGEIKQDEIFGMLAALTDTKRTATIRCKTDAMVLVLPKDNFVELIETRPATVLRMVEDMARAIIDLNEKVVEMSYIKG